MAGEDRRYTTWIRTQPCAMCSTELQIEVHHALYGTTYSPDGPRPAKAIEGARKGASQRSHDVFSIPLCIKCHKGIHELTGPFEGWRRTGANVWEEGRVGFHRNRYAMTCPEPAPSPAATRSRTTRPRATSSERQRLLEEIETWAGARRLKAEEHQLIHDLINDLKAEGF